MLNVKRVNIKINEKDLKPRTSNFEPRTQRITHVSLLTTHDLIKNFY